MNTIQSMMPMDAWVALFQVIMIDLVLAADNAIVIGLAAAGLPQDQRARARITGEAVNAVRPRGHPCRPCLFSRAPRTPVPGRERALPRARLRDRSLRVAQQRSLPLAPPHLLGSRRGIRVPRLWRRRTHRKRRGPPTLRDGTQRIATFRTRPGPSGSSSELRCRS